jgi:ERCC4-related helicase
LLSFSTEPRPDVERYQKLLKLLDDLLLVKDEQSAEIVKFLQAILDKLIEILLDLKAKNNKESVLNTNDQLAYEIHSKQIQQRVFDILVSIFQIIENQNKFASFRTVIDAYLSKNFFITLAHRPLLRLFNDLINNIFDKFAINMFTNSSRQNSFPNLSSKKSPSHRHSIISNGCISISNGSTFSFPIDTENEHALNTIKSIEYIFKFAFKSRELLSLHYKYE